MLIDNISFRYFSGIGHPKYYIPNGTNILVGKYGQYVIHERGYIDIDGNLELSQGAELIVLEA